jgi:hypothetical protein
MADLPGTPGQPSFVPPRKTNPWIIAILVLVVLCCGCFGVVGLIFGFWEPITQSIRSFGF